MSESQTVTEKSVAEQSVRQEADGSAAASGWRGVASEHRDDLTHAEGVALRSRSRVLLGELLRPHRTILLWLMLLVVVENGARLAVPALVMAGIDHGLPPLRAGNAEPLTQLVLVLLGVVVAQAASRMTFLAQFGKVGQQVLITLRRRMYRHFQSLDVAFHDKYTSGRMISRMTSDMEAIQEMLSDGFDGLVNAVLTMVGTGIMLLWIDVRLGAVCLLGFPVLLLVVRWFSRESTLAYRGVREQSALLIVQFVESMAGMRAVQAYRREPRNQDIYEGISQDYREKSQRAFHLVAIFMPCVKLVGGLTVTVVLMYGGWLVMHGDMTVGALTAFLLYVKLFFDPMTDLSQFYTTYQSASSALEKLSGVLEEKPAVSEPERPVDLPRSAGAVRFDAVEFGYDAARPVLQRLDLDVPAGQTIALVGQTGAGKTTIAKLMARFYDPTSGTVTLDGVDLQELSDAQLRRHVVMVTQENFMFGGTVADNIRFGLPEATDEQVRSAAEAVGALSFIEALPEGFATDVGKRGGRLSAGQRQLVAFARAFLADPAVLILDEATSSLDIPSERLVQQALRTVLAGRTALIIAHRLSTVEIADRVLVLDAGQVVEDGSPAELQVRPGGRYAALHEAWEASLA